MTTTIKPRKRTALLRAVAAGQADLATLARAHELPEAAVAAFLAEPETRTLLGNVCAAADYQTQLLLSRYRALAAGRLLDLASGAAGGPAGEDASGSAAGPGNERLQTALAACARVPAEVVRKACMDLLKTELPRTAAGLAPPTPDAAADAEQARELRTVLYEKNNS